MLLVVVVEFCWSVFFLGGVALKWKRPLKPCDDFINVQFNNQYTALIKNNVWL